jgi:hypothetical protein
MSVLGLAEVRLPHLLVRGVQGHLEHLEVIPRSQGIEAPSGPADPLQVGPIHLPPQGDATSAPHQAKIAPQEQVVEEARFALAGNIGQDRAEGLSPEPAKRPQKLEFSLVQRHVCGEIEEVPLSRIRLRAKENLEEQIQRQKRGERIDVEWVAEELQRVRREQIARMQASQRNLRWLVLGSAILMIVLWARNGAVLDKGGYVALGLIVIGLFAALALRRGPRA